VISEHKVRGVEDAAAVANLVNLGIEPEVGVAALKAAGCGRPPPARRGGADRRDLTLGDPHDEPRSRLLLCNEAVSVSQTAAFLVGEHGRSNMRALLRGLVSRAARTCDGRV